VCTVAASYADVLELARAALAALAAGERDEVLAGSARRFYRLG
jgi:predicted TIM-barrel fold metal-dependent hydrolase